MSIYEQLRKIKLPVMLEVISNPNPEIINQEPRFRILYPDGRCFYTLSGKESYFNTSCFISGRVKKNFFGRKRYTGNLNDTLKAMKAYDQRSGLRVTNNTHAIYPEVLWS